MSGWINRERGLGLDKPLSESEIESLVKSLAPAGADDLLISHGRNIRNYDFRRPGKFNKDLLRTLLMIHENFSRLLQTFLSAGLRTRVQVNIRNTSQYPYSEFMQSLPNPAVVAAFSIKPLPGTCLLELSQNIAYVVVDKVFGGHGSDAHPQRALSEIELGVIQRILIDLFNPLQEAWRNVADINPTLESVETNPIFLQTAAPSEVLAAITMGIQVGEHMGHLTLAFPYSTVEPVLSRLSPHSWLGAERQLEPGELEMLKDSVQEVMVPVRVHLGQTRMLIREFMALNVGDVLRLSTTVHDDLPVYVGNRLGFYAQPGLLGNRISIMLKRSVLARPNGR